DRGAPGCGARDPVVVPAPACAAGGCAPQPATFRAWPVWPPDRGAPGCGARDPVVVPAPVYAAGGWAP
ncbi:hypothetical protein, partial [Streptomyces sp. 12257]|uniref:hypothetical protein n=1 Tax=Streptomyces sp. 12257 TaxID=3041009 RepID=UPI0024A98584